MNNPMSYREHIIKRNKLPKNIIMTSSCSSRAYQFFDNMVDAHCARDEGVFTVQWLIGRVSLGYG